MNMNRREVLGALGFAAVAPFVNIDRTPAAEHRFFCSGNPPLSKLENIFEVVRMDPGYAPEFPLDLLAKDGKGHNIQSIVITKEGKPIRAAKIQSPYANDCVAVPEYDIGLSMDWPIDHQVICHKVTGEVEGWKLDRFIPLTYEVVDPVEILEKSWLQKITNDGWTTILAAASDRNLVVAPKEGLNHRFVSIFKTLMRRNGPSSLYRGKLTDLYMGTDLWESWTFTNEDLVKLDEVNRRQIVLDEGGRPTSFYGVRISHKRELSKGGAYTKFYFEDLGGVIPPGTSNLLIGLDLRTNDSFVMPLWDYSVKRSIAYNHRVTPTEKRHYLQLTSTQGMAVLDCRKVMLGAV